MASGAKIRQMQKVAITARHFISALPFTKASSGAARGLIPLYPHRFSCQPFYSVDLFSIGTITVGYGDITPYSSLARVLASLEVFCGIMLLLFGVSELLEYAREHRQGRSNK
jgi:hypothetical protein